MPCTHTVTTYKICELLRVRSFSERKSSQHTEKVMPSHGIKSSSPSEFCPFLCLHQSLNQSVKVRASQNFDLLIFSWSAPMSPKLKDGGQNSFCRPSSAYRCRSFLPGLSSSSGRGISRSGGDSSVGTQLWGQQLLLTPFYSYLLGLLTLIKLDLLNPLCLAHPEPASTLDSLALTVWCFRWSRTMWCLIGF